MEVSPQTGGDWELDINGRQGKEKAMLSRNTKKSPSLELLTFIIPRQLVWLTSKTQ